MGIVSTGRPAPLTAHSPSHDIRLAALVGIGLFAFYVAIQRAALVSWDGRLMASVAKDLWQHGRLQIGDTFGTQSATGTWSKYGIGESLLLAPLWGLQPSANVNSAVWLTLVNPVVLAVSAGLVCRIGIELRWRRSTAVTAALAFGLLTMALEYSTDVLSEPSVLLGMVVALLGLLRWEKGSRAAPWIVGTAIGWCVFFRSDSVLVVAPVLLAVPLFVPFRRLGRELLNWLPGVAVPIVVAGIWTGYYNNLRCGSVTCNPYPGEGFTFPLWGGLYRILVSPGKGFIWYNLILLIALPGFVLLWRRHRGLTLTILAMSILRIVVYAKWHDPDGSAAWGPRFLLPLCALLIIPAGELWLWLLDRSGAKRRVGVFVVTLLAAGSAFVSVLSVWVGYDQVWAEVGSTKGLQPSQYSAVIAHRMHDYFNSISGSNIVRNIHLLTRAKPFPLTHFKGQPSAIGVASLLVFLAAVFVAMAIARRDDRAARGPGPAGSLDDPPGGASPFPVPLDEQPWSAAARGGAMPNLSG